MTLRSGRADAASEWLDLIRAEYLEMPGLALTRSQASRLWCLDDTTTAELLGRLVEGGFLKRTAQGTYVRHDVQ